MNLRLAVLEDLPQLKVVYKKIIRNMDENNIQIWDDFYPCGFFRDDIENDRLYVLEENNKIISAFALCNTNPGAAHVKWKSKQHTSLYIDRFGVNVEYSRKGIGSVTLQKAGALAVELGAEYLRLFVVDINEPAINLYVKNGFEKAEGIYDEIIEGGLILHEFGFEKKITM